MLAAAAVLLFAVVPVALAGAAIRTQTGYAMTVSGPLPVDGHIALRAREAGTRVELTWSPLHATGGPLFYEILRTQHGGTCAGAGVPTCAKIVGLERRTHFVDAPPKGTYDYLILVGANWLDEPTAGDEYVAGTLVTVTVP